MRCNGDNQTALLALLILVPTFVWTPGNCKSDFLPKTPEQRLPRPGGFESELMNAEVKKVSPSDDAFDALRELKDGQTVLLETSEVRLKSKITVKASNVAVVGLATGTDVICPQKGSAFIISGTNVTFSYLNFKSCKGAAALSIRNAKAAVKNSKNSRLGSFKSGSSSLKCNNRRSPEECFLNEDSDSVVPETDRVPDEPGVRIESSRFLDSSANKQGGGAVRVVASDVIINNSTFLGNQGKDGGAISAKNAKIWILFSNFTENIATNQGGAIFAADRGKLAISDSYFWKNSAYTGGAVKGQKKVAMKIVGTTLYANNATETGGGAVGANVKLTIKHSTFKENGASVRGGAIEVYKETELSIEGCAFDKNSAGVGGAIWRHESPAVIDLSLFTANNGFQDGGAIFAQTEYSLVITNSRFDANVANFNGGAIKTTAIAELMLYNSTLARNRVPGNGGGGAGISAAKTLVKIENSLLTDNFAKVQGGGVDVREGSELIVVKSAFRGNSARSGAAVADMTSHVSVQDSEFALNKATVQGGVFFASDGANLDIKHSSFTGNECRTNGGVMFLSKSSNSSIRASVFEKNKSLYMGGVVSLFESQLDVAASAFRTNRCRVHGGVIYSNSESKVFARSSAFIANKARKGAVIATRETKVEIESSVITANEAIIEGGALFATAHSQLTVANSEFKQNTAGTHGGAIKTAGQTQLEVKDSSFDSNVVKSNGGVIYAFMSRLEVKTSNFTNNSALAGGVMQAYTRTSILVEESRFSKNEANTTGGAIGQWDSRVLVIKSSFESNVARKEGGAIYSGSQSDLRIVNSSFMTNSAAEKGGALSADDCSVTLTSSVFSSNHAMRRGGAVAWTGESSMKIEASTFLNNSAEDGGAIDLKESLLVIEKTLFDSNTVTGSGGALCLEASAVLKMNETALQGNGASSGGAAYVNGSSLDATYSTFSSNFASLRGGAVTTAERTSSLTVANSVLSENKAGLAGGAVHLSPASEFYANGSIFSNNKVAPIPAENDHVNQDKITAAGDGSERVGHGTGVNVQQSLLSTQAQNSLDQQSSAAMWCWSRTVGPMMRELRPPCAKAEKNSDAEPVHPEECSVNGGGAIAARCPGSLKIDMCKFDGNEGEQGGALAFNLKGEASILLVKNTLFEVNSAVEGGAVYVENGHAVLTVGGNVFNSNVADRGGAVCLVNSAEYQDFSNSENATIFKNNTAHWGGGLFCKECNARVESPVEFKRNVAFEYGGGAFFEEAGFKTSIAQATIGSNVASFGGGLALKDCQYLKLGESDRSVQIQHNTALNGGGVHFDLQGATQAEYQVRNTKIVHNEASDYESMMSKEDDPVLKYWQVKQQEASQEGMPDWPKCDNCTYGNGGGFFIKVRNLAESGTACTLMQGLEVTQNEAVLGDDGIFGDGKKMSTVENLIVQTTHFCVE